METERTPCKMLGRFAISGAGKRRVTAFSEERQAAGRGAQGWPN